jgi:sugar phosphate isomerase/epimerase
MLLGLETFSYHRWFEHGSMDVFTFINRCADLGLDGVQLNVNGPNLGHLGGGDAGRLREVRQLADQHDIFVEIDSRGTDPEHLAAMLGICQAVGADVLRTYASCGGDLAQELAEAPGHLRQVLPMCADLGIRIAVENHEYETSEDVLEIVRRVDSEWVGTHVDTGNSMMAWEDPVVAVAALAPLAVSSHFKDHIVIMDQEPLVVGVTLGTGSIDCAECFRVLAEESPLERLIIEVCYGYSAPFRRPQERGAGAKLGEGAFRLVAGPFDPSRVLLGHGQGGSVPHDRVLQWQDESVVESVAFVKNLNKAYR